VNVALVNTRPLMSIFRIFAPVKFVFVSVVPKIAAPLRSAFVKLVDERLHPRMFAEISVAPEKSTFSREVFEISTLVNGTDRAFTPAPIIYPFLPIYPVGRVANERFVILPVVIPVNTALVKVAPLTSVDVNVDPVKFVPINDPRRKFAPVKFIFCFERPSKL